MSLSTQAALAPSVYINNLNAEMQAENRRPMTLHGDPLNDEAVQAIVPVLVVHLAQNLKDSTGLNFSLGAEIVETNNPNAHWRLTLNESVSTEHLTIALFYFSTALKVIHNTSEPEIELSAFMNDVEAANDLRQAPAEPAATVSPQVARVIKSVGGLK